MGVEPKYRMEAFTREFGLRVLRWLDLRDVRGAIFGARILLQQQRGQRASTTTIAVWGDVSVRVQGATFKFPRTKTRREGSRKVQAVWHAAGCGCHVSKEKLTPGPVALDASGRLAGTDYEFACPIALLYHAKRVLAAHVRIGVDEVPAKWPIEASYYRFCDVRAGFVGNARLPVGLTLVKANEGSVVDRMPAAYWAEAQVLVITRAEEFAGVMYRGGGGLPGMKPGAKPPCAGVAFEVPILGVAIQPWSVGTVHYYVRAYVTRFIFEKWINCRQ